MENKKQAILDLVAEYITEKKQSQTWTPGQDWIQYSGPYFNAEEYVAGIDSLLNEW